MPVIARSYDFSPGTTIVSAQVDAEFNALYDLLNGTDVSNNVAIGGPITNSPSADPKLYVEGQVVLQTSNSGRALAIWKTGNANPSFDFLHSGEIRTTVGNQSASPASQRMVLGGGLVVRGAKVGNVLTGIDNLGSVTIGANLFGSGGSGGWIEINSAGTMAANGNNKQVRFNVGATNLLASGAVAFNNRSWSFRCILVRSLDTVNSLKYLCEFYCDTTTIRNAGELTGLDFTADIVCQFTGEATATDDIVQQFITATKQSAMNTV